MLTISNANVTLVGINDFIKFENSGCTYQLLYKNQYAYNLFI